MDTLINNKGKLLADLFTPAEIDYILCALISYEADLRSRTGLMERFAAREHLENHCGKIMLGEKILKEFHY